MNPPDTPQTQYSPSDSVTDVQQKVCHEYMLIELNFSLTSELNLGSVLYNFGPAKENLVRFYDFVSMIEGSNKVIIIIIYVEWCV